jgi:hypothetical protein
MVSWEKVRARSTIDFEDLTNGWRHVSRSILIDARA